MSTEKKKSYLAGSEEGCETKFIEPQGLILIYAILSYEGRTRVLAIEKSFILRNKINKLNKNLARKEKIVKDFNDQRLIKEHWTKESGKSKRSERKKRKERKKNRV